MKLFNQIKQYQFHQAMKESNIQGFTTLHMNYTWIHLDPSNKSENHFLSVNRHGANHQRTTAAPLRCLVISPSGGSPVGCRVFRGRALADGPTMSDHVRPTQCGNPRSWLVNSCQQLSTAVTGSFPELEVLQAMRSRMRMVSQGSCRIPGIQALDMH